MTREEVESRAELRGVDGMQSGAERRTPHRSQLRSGLRGFAMRWCPRAEWSGKSDVQILTFDIDDSLGDVSPYMKENKYTFPVLMARDVVFELMPVPSVPQNWIVDSRNKWRWSREGFGDGEEWVKDVRKKLLESGGN